MGFEGIDSLFANKLYAAIEKRKSEVVESVAYSRGVSDWSSYQRLVGHIAALDEAMGMFQTVHSLINQEGKKKR